MPDIQIHQKQAQHNLEDVYVYYRELEYQSRRSRYECASFTSEEVQRLSNHLQKIQMAVTAVVG